MEEIRDEGTGSTTPREARVRESTGQRILPCTAPYETGRDSMPLRVVWTWSRGRWGASSCQFPAASSSGVRPGSALSTARDVSVPQERPRDSAVLAEINWVGLRGVSGGEVIFRAEDAVFSSVTSAGATRPGPRLFWTQPAVSIGTGRQLFTP